MCLRIYTFWTWEILGGFHGILSPTLRDLVSLVHDIARSARTNGCNYIVRSLNGVISLLASEGCRGNFVKEIASLMPLACMLHANKVTHFKFYSVIEIKILRWKYPYLFIDKLRNHVKCNMALPSFDANKMSTKMSRPLDNPYPVHLVLSHPRQIDAVPTEVSFEQNNPTHALPGTKRGEQVFGFARQNLRTCTSYFAKFDARLRVWYVSSSYQIPLADNIWPASSR